MRRYTIIWRTAFLLVLSLTLNNCSSTPNVSQKPMLKAEGSSDEVAIVRNPSARTFDESKNDFSYHKKGDDDGVVLPSVQLRLIFWGKDWNSNPSPSDDTPRPATFTTVSNAARAIVTGNYLTGLSEYESSIGKGALADSRIYAATEPNQSLTRSAVKNFIIDRIKDRTLPYPDDKNNLYIIVMPKGVSYPAAGEHAFFSYTEDDKPDYKQVHYGFVMSDGKLDTATSNLSHEIAEAVSNAEMDAVWGTSPSCGDDSGKPQCEVADACQYEGSYKLQDGTVVDRYWSQKNKTCIMPN